MKVLLVDSRCLFLANLNLSRGPWLPTAYLIGISDRGTSEIITARYLNHSRFGNFIFTATARLKDEILQSHASVLDTKMFNIYN
jgi:hypothetical protein